ncbi:MAG TPA: glucose-6-phosphate isomerase, partial [Candidatus Limnocylindrales bacterium]|nr:glucose-6-phosphate isomerase [Candidatus Limnocylindrales bacterium]
MNSELIFDCDGADDFVKKHELDYLESHVLAIHTLLHRNATAGSRDLGWLDWPLRSSEHEVERIIRIAEQIRRKAEVFVVIGIGGSYLGARSALELLGHGFYNGLPQEKRGGPQIYFAGQNLSSGYLTHLWDLISQKEIAINVISKSGTTLEPALAFRFFRTMLEERYGRKGAGERIFVTTGEDGSLRRLAGEAGYETFTVPDNIGGRHSVLTAVGLLPMAMAGIDITAIMAGANHGCHLYSAKKLINNPVNRYAALRQILYRKGKTVELLASYEPSFHLFTEWWKQLFAESEGKDHKGIFPAGVNFTTDLHSLGQYIQDGCRNLFVTTLWVEKPPAECKIPLLENDLDGLNFLAGKTLHHVNEKACVGTIAAHIAGGVPNLKITIPDMTPYYYGQLTYFFEKA